MKGEVSVTDRQYQSILNLVAALVEKCKTEKEVKEVAKLIRDVTKNFAQTDAQTDARKESNADANTG